ncbi:MAG TPA: hypothetical protein VIS99_13535, partial [Terrimicrobiaceae bacterium]
KEIRCGCRARRMKTTADRFRKDIDQLQQSRSIAFYAWYVIGKAEQDLCWLANTSTPSGEKFCDKKGRT